MEKVMECECQDWKDNIDKINQGFVVSFIHGQPGYTGKQIKYCPWCGAELLSKTPEQGDSA